MDSASAQPVAELSNAVKLYGDRRVVDDVSFHVASGRTTMLVGPNGCGKTTSMEMLAGLRRLTEGSARICGVPVVPGGSHRMLMGVQLQQSGLPGRLRVGEALLAAASLYRKPKDIHALADSLGLAGHWSASVEKLSGGLRRRLDIAAACVGDPRFLMLDEPTSGVDPEGRAELWEFLRQIARQGTGILASTHDLEEAEAFADYLLVMGRGRIVLAGRPGEVLAGAGGDWRLRINDAPPDALDCIATSGCTHGRIGITTLVIGSRDELERLRARIEASVGDRVEVRSGRIRLEDVFAVTMWREHPDGLAEQ